MGRYSRVDVSGNPGSRRGSDSAFEATSDVVLAIASELEVGPILQKLVHAARELAGARYAALGIPDDRGGFAAFLTSGLSAPEVEAIGPLPRSHGLLDEILGTTESYRLPDVRRDPRFGGWPPNHPDMTSFLGVPIVSKGTVLGAFYLTDKKGTEGFTEEDQKVIELLAAHAAIGIDNARFFERSRELNVIEERNRLARELHDAVSQTLFSMVFTVETAAAVLGRDPDAAHGHLLTLRDLARGALHELRSVVFELRPAELDSDGFEATLRKHVGTIRRVHDVEVDLDVTGVSTGDEVDRELFRIIQEALNNALKHSGASRIGVRVALEDSCAEAEVCDDGCGFDPDGLPVRARHLGLTSMEERARALGGALDVSSTPGAGTTVSVRVRR